MKHISILLILCASLAACTSDEGTLKKLTSERAEVQFAENIAKEADEAVGSSQVLRQAYIDFIKGQSSIEVTEVKMQSPTLATVSTSVTTYPLKLRKTVLDVARRVPPDKAGRFNFGNAIPLVAPQLGIKGVVETIPFEVYKFQKQSDKWNLLE